MFDFLKKKISGFVDKIVGKGEEKAAEKKAETQVAEIEGKIEEAMPQAKKHFEEHEKKVHAKPVKKETAGAKEPTKEAAHKKEIVEEKKPIHEKKTHEHRKHEGKAEQKVAIAVSGETKTKVEKPWEAEKAKVEKEVHAPKPHAVVKKEIEKIPSKKEEKVKLSLATQVKSIFSSEVELTEKDISSALDDFELELLESDVAFEVAEQIKEDLRKELVGKKVRKGELQQQIAAVFFNSIRRIMTENTGEPILAQIRKLDAKPIKIMFAGPNGSGKTTTIAKMANMLKNNGFSVAVAAADTFRAAAIEQMEIHGNKLGVKVVKGKYGADPTSVAFDAVNYAKAHNIDVVLIDTAGRQETNLNLLNELKKMVRIINPELKVYVGESIAGNAIIEQVDAFNKELGLDGVILTKLDCDAKGGTIISISKVTRVPVLYVTTGQGYLDFEEFDAERIAKNIAG